MRAGTGQNSREASRAPDVGLLLREERERRQLTCSDVGRLLRFAEHQIRAVEEGSFDQLPPPPYARGLIAAYAALLGLEPEFILRGCGPAFAGEGTGGRTTVFHYPLRENFNWKDWTVAIILGLGVVVFMVARLVLAPAPSPLPELPLNALVVARQVQTPAPQDRSATVSETETAMPAGVRVLLRSEGSTWVDAAADAGEIKRYALGPGQNLALVASTRLAITLGDAGVVRLKVNDRELGFIGFKGETKKGLLFSAPQVPAGEKSSPGRESAGD